jgi:hypothetical protein
LGKETRTMLYHSVLDSLRCSFARIGARQMRRAAPRRNSAPGRLQLEALEDRMLLSTLTVLNAADSGAGSLRDTIAAANSGDKIIFGPSLQGQTITLTSGELAINKNLDIRGLGADQLTVSGNGASRVFDVTGSGANVTITGLTIANGLAGQGGGIFNAASNLTLSDDVLSNDQAIGGPGQTAEGGGVYNGSAATLHVTDSVFANDVAKGGDGVSGSNAGSAHGGGLFNQGVASLSDSTLSGNEAIGGASTGFGGSGFGGGIWNDVGGMLTVHGSSFLANQSIGGTHGKVADFPFLSAGGGAGIENRATLDVSDSTFTGNQSHGGAGYTGAPGSGGSGAAILTDSEDDDPPAQATVSDCTFLDNQAIGGTGGAGKAGGQAHGGAFLADHGTATIRDSTFKDNQAIGGTGGTGGNGGAATGGALREAARDGTISVLVTDSTFTDNEALGGTAGSGGVGGLASGGAVANVQLFPDNYSSSLTFRDSVLRDNEAVGGAGPIGGAAQGGGISNQGGPTLTVGGISTTVIDSLVSDNQAQGGNGSTGNGGNGLGGGIFSDATAVLTVTGSTITGNDAIGGTGAAGFSNGKGVGGGAYIAPGGSACEDDATVIALNLASTSNDDVFGVLTTC